MQKLRTYTRNNKTRVFRSALNSVVPISENPINSYDSNSVFLPHLHIFSGEQDMELAIFFVYMLILGILWMYLDV